MRLSTRGDVLVVDDDPDIREALELLLEISGFSVEVATSGESALARLAVRAFDVALIDLQLPGIGGLGVMREARTVRDDLELVIVTANGTFASAVEALRAGAYDFLQKPFSNDHVVRVIERAVERRRLVHAADEHRARSEALATLQAVTHASGSSLVVSEILDAALAITRARLGTEVAAVLLRAPGTERLSLARAFGLTSPADIDVALDDPLVVSAMARCESATFSLPGAHLGALSKALGASGVASLSVTPIAAERDSLGVLLAGARTPRPFTEAEQSLLRDIGQELAPPILNARIHAQATQRAAQLQAVDEIVRAINSEHETQGVLDLVVRRAASLIATDFTDAWLPADDGRTLTLAATWARTTGLPLGASLPMASTVYGEVFGEARARAAVTSTGITLLCPLVHRGATLGLLTAVRAGEGRFTPDDLALLDMLASHAAIAIDNARLHARERAQTLELEARVMERTRELELAQEQLVRRERLAILGRMAGSVSHEIRNPLGVLRNSVYFLKMVLQAPVDEEIAHHIVMMEEEIDRANRIVGDLLEYARVRAPVPRPIALSTALARALRENTAAPGVNVVRDFDPEAPAVNADAEQLRVVFGNLVRNAVQAMGAHGTLTVRIRSLPGAVVAEVSDSGPGISPEVRDRLFEPLVTTKTKGLGLGLATARNLVEAHHGALTVESVAGVGATFRVTLPVSTPAS